MLEGYIDRVRLDNIEGWVWCPMNPSLTLLVTLISYNGKIVSISLADEFRSDLLETGKGNGAHGFTIHFSKNTDVKGMRVFAIEYNYELVGSPLLISQNTSSQSLAHQDLYQRWGNKFSQSEGLSLYLDEFEKRISAKFSLLQLRAAELKNRFSMLRSDYSNSLELINPIDVIVLPPIDWHYRVQRPQRLAIGLAALGCRVWYISPQMLPPMNDDSGYIIYDEPTPGVFLVKLRSDYPHTEINRSPLSPQVSIQTNNAIEKLFEKMDIVSPCYLVGSPGWLPLLNEKTHNLKIYDLMDWLAGFNATTKTLLDAERELIQLADLVLCSSLTLQEYAVKELACNKTFLLRNATHTEMFTVHPPIEDKFVVGYVGAIEHWFNRDLLVEVAEALPDIKFILVGHVSPKHASLQSIPNISCVGECRPNQVAEYVKQFDVGIIPFITNELIKHTNPVKVYEYLAAGRSVVATDLPELRLFKTGVTIADTPKEFADAIRKELKNSRNRELIAERRESVIQETWAARAATLYAIILQKISEKNEK
jgi:glycosyltransferase involved in cell wall biosynthesis